MTLLAAARQVNSKLVCCLLASYYNPVNTIMLKQRAKEMRTATNLKMIMFSVKYHRSRENINPGV